MADDEGHIKEVEERRNKARQPLGFGRSLLIFFFLLLIAPFLILITLFYFVFTLDPRIYLSFCCIVLVGFAIDSDKLEIGYVAFAVYIFLSLILLYATNSYSWYRPIKLKYVSYIVPFLLAIAYTVILVKLGTDNEASAYIGLSIALAFLHAISASHIWYPASYDGLLQIERTLCDQYIKTPYTQSVIAGLGTLDVQNDDPSKPVMVLVHGFGAGNMFYLGNVDAFAKDFKVYVLELRGCGRSDKLPFKASGYAEAEEIFIASIEAWRAELDIPEMVLVGHSLGAVVVSAYTMAHPHRIKHLVLASPAGMGHAPKDHPFFHQETVSWVYRLVMWLWANNAAPQDLVRWMGPLGGPVTKFFIEKRLSWVPANSILLKMDRGQLAEYIYQNWGGPAAGERALGYILMPGAFAYHPIIEILKGNVLRCPVSVLYGSPDWDWMEISHGHDVHEELVRQGFKAIEVHCVPTAGHQVFLDNPKAFNDLLRRCLINNTLDGTHASDPLVRQSSHSLDSEIVVDMME